MNSQLADKLNRAYELCDELDGLGYGIGYGYKERDNLRASLITFVLYFSAANGGITAEDTAFVKDYFGQDMSVEMMTGLYNAMCRDNIVYQDGDYATKVPACIQSYVATDNKIYANSNDNTKSVAGDVANLLYLLGKEMKADEYSAEIFNPFMDRISDYIRDNLNYAYKLDFN